MPSEEFPTVRPATAEDAKDYAGALAKALPDKFHAIFGGQVERGIRSLADHYGHLEEESGHFVAEIAGEVAGFLHLITRESGDDGFRAAIPFIQGLGMFRGIRALLAFTMLTRRSLFSRREREEDVYIAHIIVYPWFHGQGVGKSLLDFAEEEAGRLGKRRLTLYVAADNAPAIGLYASRGFHTTRVDESRTAQRLLGKRFWNYMVKDL